MGVVSHEHVLYDVVLLVELPYLLRLGQFDQRYLRWHLRTPQTHNRQQPLDFIGRPKLLHGIY